jgi:hypothetical protein
LFRDQLTGEVGTLTWRPGEQRPALGLFDDVSYPVTRRALRPTDVVILYTDGLCDASDAEEMTFGSDRLLNDVREQGHRPTPELFDFLLARAKAFSGRETFEDDVCLLGIQMLKAAVDKETIEEFSGHTRGLQPEVLPELADEEAA